MRTSILAIMLEGGFSSMLEGIRCRNFTNFTVIEKKTFNETKIGLISL